MILQRFEICLVFVLVQQFFFLGDVLDLDQPCLIRLVVDLLRSIQELFIDLRYGSGNRGEYVGASLSGFYVSESLSRCVLVAFFRKVNEYQSPELALRIVGQADRCGGVIRELCPFM